MTSQGVVTTPEAQSTPHMWGAALRGAWPWGSLCGPPRWELTPGVLYHRSSEQLSEVGFWLRPGVQRDKSLTCITSLRTAFLQPGHSRTEATLPSGGVLKKRHRDTKETFKGDETLAIRTEGMRLGDAWNSAGGGAGLLPAPNERVAAPGAL